MGRWSEHIARDLRVLDTGFVRPQSMDYLTPVGDATKDHQHLLALSQTATIATKLMQLFNNEFELGFNLRAVPHMWQFVQGKYQRSPENGFRRGCTQLAEHARSLPDSSPFRPLLITFANATLADHYRHRAARIHQDQGAESVRSFILKEYDANRLYNGAEQRLLAAYPRDTVNLIALRRNCNHAWQNTTDGGLRHQMEEQRRILSNHYT